MRVISYNVRGLRVGHSPAEKIRRLTVDKLLNDCDILCLQETWLAKQDLDKLNTVHTDFHGAGESTTDLSTKMVKGRIAGGVAILWNRKYDPMVKVNRLNVDWAIGLDINLNGKKFTILNIYTPYESYESEDEFLNRLACIQSFIEDNECTCVYVTGDFNSDVSDKSSLFAKHLIHFCDENKLMLSSKMLLPDNSFTYVSEAWHTTSWLDHFVCTADAHASLEKLEICYDLAISDHIPIAMMLNVDNVPLLADNGNTVNPGKLDWAKLSKEDIDRYAAQTDSLIHNIELPRDALMCLNMNCTDPQHVADLCNMYDNITSALIASSEPFCRPKKVFKIKPGWNEYVAEHHSAAREAFKCWSEAGRPRQGDVFEIKKQTNARFKYAVRHIKNNENTIRADGLARTFQTNNHDDFWKAVRVMNCNKTALPADIEGVSGTDNIAQLWREHYKLFNCVKSDTIVVDNIDIASNVVVRSSEVSDAIDLLDNNKACGLDHVTAEHIKYASYRLRPMLAMCFTGFMVHGVLPNSILSVLLVPVLKDKAGKLNSRDNYRPIALASILSKVLERVILNRIEIYVLTTDNQFGFKRKHSTDLCIYALKELIAKYESQNSSIFLCFIGI